MKRFMGKLLATIVCALTCATIFHYRPKEEEIIPFIPYAKADQPQVEIHSSRGVITEAKR